MGERRRCFDVSSADMRVQPPNSVSVDELVLVLVFKVPCYIINPDNFGDNKCHVPGKRYSDVSTIGDVPKIGKFRAR